jgi:two-component system LytT family response regulator
MANATTFRMRAIIIEDEFHPRETLIQKLREKHPDIQVLVACENAESGLIEILRQQPDLLFLDIQLPEKNGLWLAEKINELACDTFVPPAVIFTTAYSDSHYLLEAFRLAAVDYLIKPIALDSLAQAIERVKTRKNTSQMLPTLIDTLQKENILRFKNFSGLILLKAADIVYFEADGNYSILHLANGETEDIFERLGEIEKVLPADIFLRAGRSLIINRSYIRKIDTRKSLLQIATADFSTNLEVPEKVVKMLK